jgi:hypothetical protein
VARRHATALVQAGCQIPAIGMFGHLVQTATLPRPWEVGLRPASSPGREVERMGPTGILPRSRSTSGSSNRHRHRLRTRQRTASTPSSLRPRTAEAEHFYRRAIMVSTAYLVAWPAGGQHRPDHRCDHKGRQVGDGVGVQLGQPGPPASRSRCSNQGNAARLRTASVTAPPLPGRPAPWPGESGRRDHRRGLVPPAPHPPGSWVTCQCDLSSSLERYGPEQRSGGFAPAVLSSVSIPDPGPLGCCTVCEAITTLR